MDVVDLSRKKMVRISVITDDLAVMLKASVTMVDLTSFWGGDMS